MCLFLFGVVTCIGVSSCTIGYNEAIAANIPMRGRSFVRGRPWLASAPVRRAVNLSLRTA